MDTKLKPYQFVWVDEGNRINGWTYIGELMSFPTPNGTIMVRRVPNHPGTMVEVPTHKVTLVERPKTYRFIHYATVMGTGYFPLDMLRYDHAAPVNFNIVPDDDLGSTATRPDPALGASAYLIAKCTNERDPLRAWTFDRWSSFLWCCANLKTEVLS